MRCWSTADAISRQLTAPGGAAIAALRQQFGDEVMGADGALDRTRMRTLAFGDAGVRQQLEAILHHLITQECARQAATAAEDQVVVFEVPLLVESGRWLDRVSRVLVVDCAVETQIQRVMQRSGWSREMVEKVIHQQASREQRRAVADAVILNDGISLDELREQVCALWARWGLP